MPLSRHPVSDLPRRAFSHARPQVSDSRDEYRCGRGASLWFMLSLVGGFPAPPAPLRQRAGGARPRQALPLAGDVACGQTYRTNRPGPTRTTSAASSSSVWAARSRSAWARAACGNVSHRHQMRTRDWPLAAWQVLQRRRSLRESPPMPRLLRKRLQSARHPRRVAARLRHSPSVQHCTGRLLGRPANGALARSPSCSPLSPLNDSPRCSNGPIPARLEPPPPLPESQRTSVLTAHAAVAHMRCWCSCQMTERTPQR